MHVGVCVREHVSVNELRPSKSLFHRCLRKAIESERNRERAIEREREIERERD